MNIEQDKKIIYDIVERYKDYIKEFVNTNGFRYTLRQGANDRTLRKIINGNNEVHPETIFKLYKKLFETGKS